jgi:outer membrane murein-binding lipoprotein Lpp
VYTLENTTDTDLVEFSFEDALGRTLFVAPFHCRAKKVCAVDIGSTVLPSRAAYRALASNGKLRSAGVILDVTEHQLVADDVELGIYIFDRIKSKVSPHTPMALAERYAMLLNRTESAKVRADVFGEIGADFVKRVSDSAATEAGYLALKIQQLAQVSESDLSAYLITANSPVFAAVPIEPTCPAALTGTVAVVSTALMAIGPVSMLVSGLVGGMINGSCQSMSLIDNLQKISNQLDQISTQLTEIEGKIDALGYDLDAIKDQISLNTIRASLVDFEKYYNQLTAYTNQYQNFLNDAGYQSLDELVNANGGLTPTTYANAPMYQHLLGIQGFAAQVQAVRDLSDSNRLANIASNIVKLCGDPSSIVGDAI